jgi:hypothetical protein
MQPNHYQFQGSGSVLISNGEAYLGGQSFIANPQLNNNIAAPFVLKFVIQPDPSGTISFDTVSLLNSCSGDPRASVEMYIERTTSRLVTTIKVQNPSGLTTTRTLYNTVNKVSVYLMHNKVSVYLMHNKLSVYLMH